MKNPFPLEFENDNEISYSDDEEDSSEEEEYDDSEEDPYDLLAEQWAEYQLPIISQLSSRIKLTWPQVFRKALTDTYANNSYADALIAVHIMPLFNISDDEEELSPVMAASKVSELTAEGQKQRINYINTGDQSPLRSYYWLNPLKLPEFIVTLICYGLDRLCLVGLPITENNYGRAENLSWLRLLIRVIISVSMSIPLFLIRCLCSPINTFLIPIYFLTFCFFGHPQRIVALIFMWVAYLLPTLLITSFFNIVIAAASAMLQSVPLFSAQMSIILFGTTNLASIAVISLGILWPAAIFFVIALAGFQIRPSDALYLNEINMDRTPSEEFETPEVEHALDFDIELGELHKKHPSIYQEFSTDYETLDQVYKIWLKTPRPVDQNPDEKTDIEKNLSTLIKKFFLKFSADKHPDQPEAYHTPQMILNKYKKAFDAKCGENRAAFFAKKAAPPVDEASTESVADTPQPGSFGDID